MARFFYDLSSPYAYLAAHRVEDVVGEVEWCPIAFGPLLVATQRVPWSLRPGREEGMRECERRAAERGLPPIVWPEGWPADCYSVNPARAALAAKRDGRAREVSMALYEQVFVHGRRLDDPAILGEMRDAVEADDVKRELREATDEAMALGVTGVPTVEIGGELFWGDDRLEQAAAVA